MVPDVEIVLWSLNISVRFFVVFFLLLCKCQHLMIGSGTLSENTVKTTSIKQGLPLDVAVKLKLIYSDRFKEPALELNADIVV